MKLYTHEDVLAMMNTFHTSIINRDFCMAKLTPIEINEISDEEILKAAKECVYDDLDISVGSFELGARWYREQLKKK